MLPNKVVMDNMVPFLNRRDRSRGVTLTSRLSEQADWCVTSPDTFRDVPTHPTPSGCGEFTSRAGRCCTADFEFGKKVAMVVLRMDSDNVLDYLPKEVSDLVYWTRSRIHPHESCELRSGNEDDVKVLNLTLKNPTRRPIVWTIEDQSHVLPSFKGIRNSVIVDTPDDSDIVLPLDQVHESFKDLDGNVGSPGALINVPTVGDTASVMQIIVDGPFGLDIDFFLPETVNQRELLAAVAQGHRDYCDKVIDIDTDEDEEFYLSCVCYHFALTIHHRNVSLVHHGY